MPPTSQPVLAGLVGESEAFRTLIREMRRAAGCDLTVRIEGETGTGKSLCAGGIHELSARARMPFIVQSCSVLSPQLLEDDLFGHVEGAFTGAAGERHGLVRAAEGGTLCLREVDLLSLEAQAQLLRFLESREYRPLGSTETHRADIRLIVVTSTDLRSAVESGRIRGESEVYVGGDN